MIGNESLLLGDDGYQISRSVRLRSSASAYFNRTSSGSGSTTTATFSVWVKRGALGSTQAIFGCERSSAADGTTIWFDSSDKLNVAFNVAGGSTNGALVTTQVFRDPSAWYHIVAAIDTTQATAANRMLLYVNGAQVTAFTTNTNPTQNSTIWVGTASLINYIGRVSSSVTWLFDGYLAEYNVINGQQLTPASFGETDSITGVWKPKKYTGTYGTNGFYLNFSDNSAATAAAIGKDYSGNGNNWTPNNISVTSGATYDSMLDVPTAWADGGNGRGNYCTLNPLHTGLAALTNGNLYAQSTAAAYRTAIGTFQFPASGKWYFEATIVSNNGSGNNQAAGITSTTNGALEFYLDCFATSSTSVRKLVDGTASGSYGSAGNGTVIGVAVDADNGKAYLAVNDTWIDSSSPTGGTGGYSMTAGQQYAPLFRGYNSGQSAFNFGQRPFAYTPPSGFKALHTGNLPEPTIKKGNQYFDATTYSGTGANRSVVNSGGMQPDLVWVKARSTTTSHMLADTARGVGNILFSNLTNAESASSVDYTSFNSDGFSVGTGASVNASGQTFVGWQWKEGATQGFDIVTYAGTGANQNISHSLGVAPRMIIAKTRSGVNDWVVYHASASANGRLLLNTTGAYVATATAWNNTAPTSSVFTIAGGNAANAASTTNVAYLFSEVAGFSRFGSYTGNGSADGPFVFTGMKPRWIMVKRTDVAGNWVLWDTARNTANLTNNVLYPNLSQAEDAPSAARIGDILSNGFKLRGTDGDVNANGGTYIFAAFAENPFKYSLAR